jgi:transcriptional regulator with XRE-family HTH domain
MAGAVFSPAYRKFIDCLIQARKDAGVTQVELAGRVGKPQSFVSKAERGERRIDVVEFTEWARGLRMAPERLFAEYLSRILDTE